MSNIQEYKCPACGGALEFSSALQKLKCPYCDTVYEVSAFEDEPAEPDVQHPQGEGGTWEENEIKGLSVYICQSCSGEIIGDETMGATSCPYCGNRIVVKGTFAGDLRPEWIIPFQLDKEAAKKAYHKHISGKKLLPGSFRDENHIDKIQGVYVPFWLFDCDADAEISYKAERRKEWRDSRYRYVETTTYEAVRNGTLGFEQIPVDGSKKMPDDLMDSIEPFDYQGMKPFRASYLAGYLADRYDVSADDCIGRAESRIKSSVETAFAETVTGYNRVHVKDSSVQVINDKAHYVLLPVWLLNTTWQGKPYLFAMNGQTGKMVGDLPVSRGAFWRWWAIYAAAITAAVTAVMSLAAAL